MISTYQRLKRRRDAGEINGFTLIELLIVIVVLGILAAVVIFALGGITGKSQVAACQADGATLSTAISAFRAENPTVQPTSALLVGSTETAATDGGPYIQTWPGGNSYVFTLVPLTGSTAVTIDVANSKTGSTAKAYTAPSVCNNIGLSS